MTAVSKTTVEKVYYLDFLRIIAIIFVILLHGLTPYINNVEIFGTNTWWLCLFFNAIARAGVPLFFMISGYLLLNSPKTLNVFTFYKKRFIKILLPFIIWNIIYFVCFGLIKREQDVTDFFKELLVNGSSYHFWYVYTLSGIYLIMPFLKRIVDNCSLKELAWFLFIITFASTIRPLINTVQPISIFLFDPLMEGYIGYIILGYILGKMDIGKLWRYLIYAGGLAGLLLSIIGNHLYSSSDQINLYFNGGYQINHFLIAASIFVFFKYLKLQHIEKIYPFISKVSGVVYSIYLMHVLVLSIIQSQVAFSKPVYNILFTSSMTFIICLGIMLTVTKIKNMTQDTYLGYWYTK